MLFLVDFIYTVSHLVHSVTGINKVFTSIFILNMTACFLHFILAATVLKTECGSLPEGKVKIKLEHDGTILDVDEDDIEKVSTTWIQLSTDGHQSESDLNSF